MIVAFLNCVSQVNLAGLCRIQLQKRIGQSSRDGVVPSIELLLAKKELGVSIEFLAVRSLMVAKLPKISSVLASPPLVSRIPCIGALGVGHRK